MRQVFVLVSVVECVSPFPVQSGFFSVAGPLSLSLFLSHRERERERGGGGREDVWC